MMILLRILALAACFIFLALWIVQPSISLSPEIENAAKRIIQENTKR